MILGCKENCDILIWLVCVIFECDIWLVGKNYIGVLFMLVIYGFYVWIKVVRWSFFIDSVEYFS